MFKRLLIAAGLVVFSSSAFAYLSVDKFHAAMTQHINEVPQCTSLEVDGGKLGEHYHYSVTHGDESVNVFARMDGDEVESFEAVAPFRNDTTMRMMMCVSVALMRGVEPDITNLDEALEYSGEMWSGAANRPYSKVIVLNRYTTQLVPLKIVVEQS